MQIDNFVMVGKSAVFHRYFPGGGGGGGPDLIEMPERSDFNHAQRMKYDAITDEDNQFLRASFTTMASDDTYGKSRIRLCKWHKVCITIYLFRFFHVFQCYHFLIF